MSSLHYSTKLRDAIDELRPAFREISQGFTQLTRKRAEIAPVFTRAYQLWRRETRRPFIAFIHELDPTMPVGDRDAYRQHSSYRAAQYLIQLSSPNENKSEHRGRTPLAMLAIAIKSLLPLSHPHQKEVLATLMHATGWREQDRAKLLATIRKAHPVALPQLPRLVKSAQASKAAVIALTQARERVA